MWERFSVSGNQLLKITEETYSLSWQAVLRIRDPVPFWPLDPGSGMGKKPRSGSGMFVVLRAYKQSFRLKIPKYLMRIRIQNLFDPVSGIRDGKKSDPDSGYKHPGSATLLAGLRTGLGSDPGI
jgi:hypothetical protein